MLKIRLLTQKKVMKITYGVLIMEIINANNYSKDRGDIFFQKNFETIPSEILENFNFSQQPINKYTINSLMNLTARLIYNKTRNYNTYNYDVLLDSLIIILYSIKKKSAYDNKDSYIDILNLIKQELETDNTNSIYENYRNFRNSKNWSFDMFKIIEINKYDPQNKNNSEHKIPQKYMLPDFLPNLYNGIIKARKTHIDYKRKTDASSQPNSLVKKQLMHLDFYHNTLLPLAKDEDIINKILYYYKFEYVYGCDFLYYILKDIKSFEDECVKKLVYDNDFRENFKIVFEEPILDKKYTEYFLKISNMPNILSRHKYIDIADITANNPDNLINDIIPLYQNTLFTLLKNHLKNDDIIEKEISNFITNRLSNFDLTEIMNSCDPTDEKYCFSCYNSWFYLKSIIDNLDKLTSDNNIYLSYAFDDINGLQKYTRYFTNIKNSFTLILDDYFQRRYTKSWWDENINKDYKDIFI